jgi:Ca-activated chloride channel family protein
MNFATPGWLALLILLPLLAVTAVLSVRLRRRQWTSFVAPRLRNALLKRTSGLPRWLALAFLLAACAAAIVALARPHAEAGTRVEKTLGRNLLIALDLSRSMRVADVKPDRLTQAKVVIFELLEAMPNDRIGLIGFAGNSYLYAPLTIDHTAVREIVEQIDENWPPLGGSDIGSAVELATETLRKTGQKNNALVILSDGEENAGDLSGTISDAERAGLRIVSIGVGTEDGNFVPSQDFPGGKMRNREGKAVISQLKTGALRKLAEGTNGRFALAGSGQDITDLVKSVTANLDAFEMDGRERKISIEFYQWLMLPAVLFLMASIALATRWRGVRLAALALVGSQLAVPAARASEASDAKAALNSGSFEQAREDYRKLAEKSRFEDTKARYRLGQGTAAYRAKNYRDARAAFSSAILSDSPAVRKSAHIGLGNALFQLGWKDLTGKDYPRGAAETPGLNEFDAIVKDRISKLSDDETADSGDDGLRMFKDLITNWTDAVRHYDSAKSLTPGDPLPDRDREMTVVYLKRLQELLEEETDQAKQAMPQPGESPPQEGDGQADGDKENGQEKGDKGKNGDKPDKSGDKGDKPEDKDGKGRDGKKPDEKDGKDKGDKGDKGKNPNETPEQRARRILKENADLEKGPLSPGRREFRNAEKDW